MNKQTTANDVDVKAGDLWRDRVRTLWFATEDDTSELVMVTAGGARWTPAEVFERWSPLTRIHREPGWQVQKSNDGNEWVGMKLRGESLSGGMEPGAELFEDYEDALSAAQHLRNATTWAQVRLVAFVDDEVVDTEPVL